MLGLLRRPSVDFGLMLIALNVSADFESPKQSHKGIGG